VLTAARIIEALAHRIESDSSDDSDFAASHGWARREIAARKSALAAAAEPLPPPPAPPSPAVKPTPAHVSPSDLSQKRILRTSRKSTLNKRVHTAPASPKAAPPRALPVARSSLAESYVELEDEAMEPAAPVETDIVAVRSWRRSERRGLMRCRS
jgi:hypothetical protein